MKIVWSKEAKLTYFKELEFINLKWNNKQVNIFIDLVDDFIKHLQSKTLIGKPQRGDSKK